MKNALINIESKRIIRVKDGDFLNVPEFAEVVSISNAKASAFESSTEPMFLISNEVVSLDEKIATERQERKEERFAENSDLFRSRKIEEIKKGRDAEYNAILVTSDGLQFKSDLETIIDVKTLIETLPDGGSFVGYKSADGSYNTITKEQFQNAITEGITRKIAAFSKEAQLAASVSAATTLAELEAIVW
jgi:hypothetical protein